MGEDQSYCIAASGMENIPHRREYRFNKISVNFGHKLDPKCEKAEVKDIAAFTN